MADKVVQETAPLGSIAYEYDAVGRRTSMTVAGQEPVNYTYDANGRLINISTVNTVLGRTLNFNIGYDPLGRRTSLGYPNRVTTNYTPFGETEITGELSDNSFQYTGRENDGTGLYYYRARYYSPELKRFISEDPIGFAGGINFFVYVGNNPVNLMDPLGLYTRDTICDDFDILKPICEKVVECVCDYFLINSALCCKFEYDACIIETNGDPDGECTAEYLVCNARLKDSGG